jgi:hypothetical protein
MGKSSGKAALLIAGAAGSGKPGTLFGRWPLCAAALTGAKPKYGDHAKLRKM